MELTTSVTLVSLLLVPVATATTTNWINASGGAYSDAANWSAGVPSVADTGTFDLEGSYVVSLTSAVGADRIMVEAGTVTFDLGAESLGLLNPIAQTPSLTVSGGTSEDAVVMLQHGEVAASFVSVADGTGSLGELSVASDAVLATAYDVSIGARGAGTWSVSGTVSCGAINLAALASGSADLVVHGNGLVASAGDLRVGGAGKATMHLSEGATLSATDLIVAHLQDSSGVVSVVGPDAALLLAESLDVGFDSTGHLAVRDGGRVETGTFLVVGTLPPPPWLEDPPPGGAGVLEVLDPDSTVSVGTDLWMPMVGHATVVVGDGARLTIAGDLHLGFIDRVSATVVLGAHEVGLSPVVDVGGTLFCTDFPPFVPVLNIELTAGFTPELGQTFRPVTADALDGLPPLLNLPPLPSNLTWLADWLLEPGNTELSLEIVRSPDLDGDGAVNSADLGILLSAWNTPAADLDGDGTTDGSDLSVLLAAWT